MRIFVYQNQFTYFHLIYPSDLTLRRSCSNFDLGLGLGLGLIKVVLRSDQLVTLRLHAWKMGVQQRIKVVLRSNEAHVAIRIGSYELVLTFRSKTDDFELFSVFVFYGC
jgi:hypothetical protein